MTINRPTTADTVKPQWTDHLPKEIVKLSTELDEAITKELKDAPKPIMVERKA